MRNPPDRFGDYAVDGVLGHGGFATVYRAHPVAEPDHAVALKVLDERHRGADDLDRLHREFDFAARVAHPHVVTVYDRGDVWLSMEVIGGGTVTGLGSMPDVLSALADVADALDHAHRLGVVHCDVKPSNVLVHDDFATGGAVLVDFGVAHALTGKLERRATRIEASLPYTAPEILRGHSPTATSDEYSLACATVELLTGSAPFAGTTAMGLIDAHLNAAVPRYSRRVAWISHAFDSILAKAMAKDPDLRYPTCAEFIRLVTRSLVVS